MSYAVETIALTKRFPAEMGWRGLFLRQEASQPAVDDVNLAIREGELFGLVGPNGAGKTTLIKMLSTLIIPTSGSAKVNGYPLSQQTFIKASIGLVASDERSFYWRLNGRQNLEFFAALHNLPHTEVKSRVEEVLELVGLTEAAGKRFQTYSTGMRQRLSIARALLNRPRLLFLDEPTKGLDPLAIQSLHQFIREELVDRQGVTILLTSHWLHEVEKLCDRVAIIHQGRILACGTMNELRREIGPDESLETIFTQLVRNGSPDLTPRPPSLKGRGRVSSSTFEGREGEITDEGGTQRAMPRHPLSATRHLPSAIRYSPSAIRQLPSAIRHSLRIVAAFLERDFYEEVSYRFSFLLQFFSIFFSAAVFYFIAKMIGNAAIPYLEPYGGDYFAFVLIGIAFAGYFSVGLSGFSSSLRQAQTTGTLEAMLTTPTSLSTIILSSSLWNYLLTTLKVIVYLLVGAIFLGVDIGSGNYPAALLVLILTIVSFSSLGIVAASFIMVLKRGDPVTWLFNAASSLLGGVFYPIAVLPAWLQIFSYLLPMTYALRAMRLALLQGASLTTLLPDILTLAAFSVILLPSSLLVFRYAVQRAKVDGSLTHY